MSVLDRSALEASPLADLHAIASELSIDGYRRLRRPELIDAILTRQEGGEPVLVPASRSRRATKPLAETAGERESAPAGEEDEEPSADEEPAAEEEPPAGRRRRGRRGGARGRGAAAPESGDGVATAEEAREAEKAGPEAEKTGPEAEKTGPEAEKAAPKAEKKAPKAERKAPKAEKAAPEAETKAPEPEEPEPAPSEEVVEGVVELLANGSGFVRIDPPDPSDEDVYISSAQVKRCELVSGDRVAGPKRAPRRSERFASLIRVETINGRPASELADSVRFDDLPAAFPADRLEVGSGDETLKAIESLAPFGKGSRVTIAGPSRSGKTEALRRLAQALAGRDDLSLSVVLAGVRPEEIGDWTHGEPSVAPVATVSFAGSEEARNGAIEPAIDQGRRLAARGADAVVLIDTLDGASRHLARKAMAAARNIVDGGSLTVIATASEPLGGETTVIALDAGLASLGRFPALNPLATGTLRAELLVGPEGAEAIVSARGEAVAEHAKA